jgi:rhamnosyltransferase
MAHYDPQGFVAPHARRQVEALAAAFDDVVVVTTAELADEGRAWLGSRTRLIERENEGYDFYSYKVGLDSSDLSSFDEVVICNDTYVGPLRPYAEIIANMEGVKADFWGFTGSTEISPHIQSFFVVFRTAALTSDAFRDFWADMEPISSRFKVIRRYEIGMSKRLYAAGLTSATYFSPTPHDKAILRQRVRWFALHRAPLPRNRKQARLLRDRMRAPGNPCAGLADAALDAVRLPMVKIDTFRNDPYGLDAPGLLSLCEDVFPAEFAGVREYLDRTAPLYPLRNSLRTTPRYLRPFRASVNYRVRAHG